MDSQTVQKLAEGLKQGQLPEAQPWDIAAAVRSIADGLPARATALPEVRNATRVLNDYRHFVQTRTLADAWTACDGPDPTVTKRHAQALINLGALDQAEQLLNAALGDARRRGASVQARSEIPEFAGLLARVEKQRFANDREDKEALVRATNGYLAQYKSDPGNSLWHGINVVALLKREERENVVQQRRAKPLPLARKLYNEAASLYSLAEHGQWFAAIASEASLALDKCDDAELWLYRFLHHPHIHPFHLESYDRQLREIWQGSAAGGAGCADRLTAIMTRHILREQRQWTIATADIPAMAQTLRTDPAAFEKNFSGESTFSLAMVKRMLEVCDGIGCVTTKTGERMGTGFLVKGSWLHQAFGEGPVFVTNAHVISDTVKDAIPWKEARVTFEVQSAAQGDPVFHPVSEQLFSSPPGDLGVRVPGGEKLDVTVVRLAAATLPATTLPPADGLPLVDPKTKAYVVGHPRGSGLQISLHDSVLLDIDDDERLMHYRTPTDPGSSGSPVFNARWEVIGVHHGGSRETPRLRGSGTYEANEAIALGSVRAKLGG
jgi:hypothetical protein